MRHVHQRMNFFVVAKSPLPRVLDVARQRGWKGLRFLSTAGNTYDRDYFGDSLGLSPAMREQQDFKPGEEWDMPILNIFRRNGKSTGISGAASCSMCRPRVGGGIEPPGRRAQPRCGNSPAAGAPPSGPQSFQDLSG
jgi:hypothetical protein